MRDASFLHGLLLPIPGVSISHLDEEGRRVVETGVRRRRCRVTYHRGTEMVATVEVFRFRRFVGHLDAVDGPAYLEYDVEGALVKQAWCRGGETHRIGGPAVIQMQPDGLRFEEWSVRGKWHRIDGPALMQFERDGSIGHVSWCFEGFRMAGPSGVARALDDLSPKDLHRHLEQSSFAELLAEGVDPRVIVSALAGGVWSHDGVREVAAGAPVEWVASFESGTELGFLTATSVR